MKFKIVVLAVTFCSVVPAQSGAAKKAAAGGPTREFDAKAALASSSVIEPPIPSRTVIYGERDVVSLNAKLRYTTVLVLPKSEEILEITCGDKEMWVVNAVHNLAYIKPAKPSAQTNLNLITASGGIYSFLLKEVSGMPKAEPDLKIFIEPRDESALSAAQNNPRFYSAQQMEDYKRQAELAKEEAKQTKASTQAAIDKGISSFVEHVRFPYRFEAGRKPFNIRAMYTDDRFTYVRARPEETPIIYENKDGKPSLVHFQYRNGVYIVGKVLDSGYFALGKKRLAFSRQE